MVRRPVSDRLLSFWPLQGGGWLFYTLAIAATNVPLRHHRDLITFRFSGLICAFLESFVLYAICRALWRKKLNLLSSLSICAVTAAVLGLFTATFTLWAESRVSIDHGGFNWPQVFSNAPGAAFVLIAWAAVYFGIQHYKLSESERKRAAEAERLARGAQLQALRYQLQPHFLFNTLNAISSLVVLEDSRGATEMIARLSDLLRSSLDGPEAHFVPLSEEVRVAIQYLEIEKVRFRDRLRVSFEVDPDTLEIPVPRFLLQPLLENAVRHGISHLKHPGTIRLASARHDSCLLLSIFNDCDPAHLSRQENPSGIGLRNTRKRLDQIYGSSGTLEALPQPEGGFSVKIRFPATATALSSRTLRRSL